MCALISHHHFSYRACLRMRCMCTSKLKDIIILNKRLFVGYVLKYDFYCIFSYKNLFLVKFFTRIFRFYKMMLKIYAQFFFLHHYNYRTCPTQELFVYGLVRIYISGNACSLKKVDFKEHIINM